jgi:NAD(P)-dependent dehydrogenase (short-subunit alcohol dehydrogenase family)
VHKAGVVLVTGASTGIGRDAALALAKREPKLLVYAGVRSKDAGKAIEALNMENLKALTLDVTSDKSVDGAYKAIAKEMQARGLPFVGLVNNAGIAAVRACVYACVFGWAGSGAERRSKQ